MMPMGRLLAEAIGLTGIGSDTQVTDLCLRADEAGPNQAFFAVKGTQTDGRHYIGDAVKRGCSVIVAEADGLQNFPAVSGAFIVPVRDLAQKLGKIASYFFGRPSDKLRVIGVTGTNGKTTCTHLLSQCLSALGQPCAVMGTLGWGPLDALKPSPLTTPDPITLQRQLADLLSDGIHSVAMEVSSHSLAQARVTGVKFDSAIFTNLTQDHLDFHQTMAAYAEAKQQLFRMPSLRHAIVNIDSPYGALMLEGTKAVPIRYGICEHSDHSKADLYADRVACSDKGLEANVVGPWGQGPLHSSLLGRFNVYNNLAVLASLCCEGVPWTEARGVLAKATGVLGRMQRFGAPHTPQIFVDYSHTPGALQAALLAARELCQGQLWCVFGCGGMRDRSKRAQMGTIASEYADYLVLTNDNPRNEAPHLILDEILQGVSAPAERVTVTPNREAAILETCQAAALEDTIVVAGKGHEAYQLIGDVVHRFSDVACVQDWVMRSVI